MKKKIGYIGLGLMGSQMVLHLINDCDYEVIAYAKNPKITERFSHIDNVTLVENEGAVARQCHIICTNLPGPDESRKAYLGPNGIFNNAAPGSVTVEFSTVGPSFARELYAEGKARGIKVVDCPISGGPENCLAGTGKMLCGCEDEVFPEVEQLLTDAGSIIHRLGLPGSGQTVKVLNNTLSLGNFVVALEAFTLGVKAGVKPEVLSEILRNSGAKAYQLEKRLPLVVAGDFSPHLKMKAARKDEGLALGMGREIDYPLHTLHQVHEMLTGGLNMGLSEEDFSAVIKYYERAMGVVAHNEPVA